MPRKTILKQSFRLKGQAAMEFLIGCASDNQLLELENKSTGPALEAVQKEIARRNLNVGNYEI